MIRSGLGGLNDSLEHRQHRLQVGQLLLVDEDQRVVELDAHLLGVGDEIGGDVAAVELHAFDDFQLGLEALGLLHRDHALIADLLHRFRDLAPISASPLEEIVPTWATSLEDEIFFALAASSLTTAATARSTPRFRSIGLAPAATDLAPSLDDRLGKNRGRGRAVAGDVVGLGGDFLDHLGAHILELVLKLDFFGDCHAVLGDPRRAESLVEHDVAALRTKRHLHRVGEDVHAAKHPLAGVLGKFYFFRCHFHILLVIRPEIYAAFFLPLATASPSMTPMMSLSFMIRRSSPSILTSVPDHLPNRIAIAGLHVERDDFALFVAGAWADGDDFALLGLLLSGIRNDDAASGFHLRIDTANDHTVMKRTKLHR